MRKTSRRREVRVLAIDLSVPKLVLGISGGLSSTGDIERVRFIGDIVRDHNQLATK
jgi:hypothetical protein